MTARATHMHARVPARPVYLAPENCEVQVDLEGPALRIERDGKAPSHLPLRRVSRILAGQRVQFSTSALLACADRGITVVIQNQEGRVIARWVGLAAERTQLAQRMVDFLDRPDWRERYDLWRDAMERRTAIVVARRLEAPHHLGPQPAQLERWIGQAAGFFADPKAAEQTAEVFRGFCVSWMQSRLHEAGLGADTEAWQSDNPDLVSDLAALLNLRVQPVRLGWHRRRHEWQLRTGRSPKPITQRTLVGVWEKASTRTERLGQDIINRFHRWLVSLA